MTDPENSSTLGIAPPQGFDTAAYTAIHDKMRGYNNSHRAAWRSFGSAWNGLLYRHRCAQEHCQTFVELIGSPNPSFTERYRQDLALFSFFSCALSTLECFSVGAHCIASTINSQAFPVSSDKELREINPGNVARRYGSAFPETAIAETMCEIFQADSTYEHIKTQRDYLSHRGTLPRTLDVGGDDDGKVCIPDNAKKPSTDWQFTRELNSQTTGEPYRWLEQSIARLLVSMKEFCDQRLLR